MTTKLEAAIAATDAAWDWWERTSDAIYLAEHSAALHRENRIRLAEFAALIERIDADVAAMKGGAK